MEIINIVLSLIDLIELITNKNFIYLWIYLILCYTSKKLLITNYY